MMGTTFRHYQRPHDFDLIGDFLVKHYQPGNKDGNWIQPTWEYMHCHPYLDESSLDKIGIWEDAGEIVGAVHYETVPGEAFFELHPDYPDLKPEILAYAEIHLIGIDGDGRRSLKIYIKDFDADFAAMAIAKGYKREEGTDWPLSMLPIPDPFPRIALPEGCALKSLQDENDPRKINRVIWRGFNHSGEPPEEDIEGRKRMQSGPHFRKDLTIVVEAPDGNYASFAGTWYEPVNRIAVVEPVATDPD